LINPDSRLTIMRQCELLDLNRSSVYYQPKPIGPDDLALMRRIDELLLLHPFFGSRRLAQMLKREGVSVGRLHVATLMRRMGIEAIYRKKRTSIPGKGHTIYPYLLRDVTIQRANQVWAADITYLPMAKGFAYLVAIVDLYSRKVLAYRVSNAMTSEFCVEALSEALGRYGAPEIFNTDQGSQFTADDFTAPLLAKRVRVSMDGKGRWIDNVFVERLWRSVKYELVYLHAHESIGALKAALREYFKFFNRIRPHQNLDYQTPDEVYCGTTKPEIRSAVLATARIRAPRVARNPEQGTVEVNTAGPKIEKLAIAAARTRSKRTAGRSHTIESVKDFSATARNNEFKPDKFKKAA
jgi:putative transposase